MTEYHVGCGAFGIYAGILNKNKTMWKNKSNVTNEALDAVAQYLLLEGIAMDFNYKNEKYCLKVEKVNNIK